MVGRHRIFIVLLVTIPDFLFAQLPAIGNWREHLPYHQAVRVFNGPGKIICSTPFSLFSIDKQEKSIDRISKLTGLTETGISAVQYDSMLDNIVIGYTSSNIDIVHAGNTVNIPDFKLKNIPGNKTIYQVFVYEEKAYLATGIGILVVDENRNEITDTYMISDTGGMVKVNSITAVNNILYAATAEGLKSVSLASSAPADYHNWSLLSGSNGLPATPVNEIIHWDNSVAARIGDSVFITATNGNAWSFFYNDGWIIRNISASGSQLLLSEQKDNNARIAIVDSSGLLVNVLQQPGWIAIPNQAIAIDKEYWVADSLYGLFLLNGGSPESFVPNSPQSLATGDMIYANGSIWAAAGGMDSAGNPQHNPNGLYRFDGSQWTNYNRYTYPFLDTVWDLVSLAGAKDSTIWCGSYGDGLLQISNGSFQLYKQNTFIGPAISDPDEYRVTGLDADARNNLWIANDAAVKELVVHKNDGSWQSFSVPLPVTDNRVAQVLVDDVGQVWMIASKASGLIAYNPGKSIDATNDDQWKQYLQGAGNGNLPDNQVLCLAKDKNGFIWVGTVNGIGIIQCANNAFSSPGCEAILPVVQFDNFAGYLFYNEQVQTIMVDGADRKWIGTRNGAWLIAPDGKKIVHHFTEDNSPLLSNDVRKIQVDPVTGEVFFATSKGICSFRGEATAGGSGNNGVLVFPNPVPPGYTGTIGIKGLVKNAIVKIAEMDGRLVYQTVALGGQATWDGRDYKGRRVSAGVYLVLISDESRQEQAVTKIVIIGQ